MDKFFIILFCLASALEFVTSSNSDSDEYGGGDGGYGGDYGYGFPESRNLGNLIQLLKCQPFNRTLVKQGLPCFQPYSRVQNCFNQWCVCGIRPTRSTTVPSNSSISTSTRSPTTTISTTTTTRRGSRSTSAATTSTTTAPLINFWSCLVSASG